MAGLHEFPYFEQTSFPDWQAVQNHLSTEYQILPSQIRALPKRKHSFTKYRVTLEPAVYCVERKPVLCDYMWTPLSQLRTLPFSSGHKRVLNDLLHLTEEASLWPLESLVLKNL